MKVKNKQKVIDSIDDCLAFMNEIKDEKPKKDKKESKVKKTAA